MIYGLIFLLLIIILVFCNIIFMRYYRGNYYDISGIIVRVSQPTISQQKRYLEWMELLSQKYLFWIITDYNTTLLSNFSNVFRISVEHIKNKYPSIQTIRNPGHCSLGYMKDDFFYPYISHTENVIEWMLKYNIKFKYLWIIEQDFGCTGKLSEFLQIYDSTDYDFITSEILYYTKDEWPHINCCSDNYLKWREKYSNVSNAYTTKEFIQRWSYNLVMKLSENLKSGIHAISEASVPETVIFCNLTYKTIERKYISDKFDWNRRVSEEKWKEILNITNDIKLYHALKF